MDIEERLEEQAGPGLGTERRRSRSGVPSPGPGAPRPPGAPSEAAPEPPEVETATEAGSSAPPRARRPARSPRTLSKPGDGRDGAPAKVAQFTPQQKILILDTWSRSGLPAGDFSHLVGVSTFTLYGWRKRFETLGPEGLMDRPRGGPKGSRLSEITKRTVLLLKKTHPEWGCQRLSDMLLRGPGLQASPGAVAKLLHDAGYVLEDEPTRPHGVEPRRFERARPNQLWQTDLFTFVLKRQNRRVYLVVFLDDHSRFVVAWGLHATQSALLVIEVLRSALTNYPAPEEILTDNGAQYVTWRGKSAFAKELERRGIRHLVSRPQRPQTLGKVERLWGSLWRECLQAAVFVDLEDARKRIGLYFDHYNFQRPHQSLDGLVPADRYFQAAPEVLRTLKERLDRNALELARNGLPRAPFYLTGNAGGQPFSVHAEGERLYLRRGDGEREEVELASEPSADAEALAIVEGMETSPPELPDALTAGVRVGATPSRELLTAPGASPIDGLEESLAGLDVDVDAAGVVEGDEPPREDFEVDTFGGADAGDDANDGDDAIDADDADDHGALDDPEGDADDPQTGEEARA